MVLIWIYQQIQLMDPIYRPIRCIYLAISSRSTRQSTELKQPQVGEIIPGQMERSYALQRDAHTAALQVVFVPKQEHTTEPTSTGASDARPPPGLRRACAASRLRRSGRSLKASLNDQKGGNTFHWDLFKHLTQNRSAAAALSVLPASQTQASLGTGVRPGINTSRLRLRSLRVRA